jgi:hypothetical protein
LRKLQFYSGGDIFPATSFSGQTLNLVSNVERLARNRKASPADRGKFKQ